MENIEEIYQKIESLSPLSTTNFIIQGGYFESNLGVDDFSINTFNMAVNLGKLITDHSPSSNLSYSILINDLGQSCSENGCVINEKRENDTEESFAQLANLIQNSGIHQNKFSCSTEKNLKNRGLRNIRKILKTRKQDQDSDHLLYFQVQEDVNKLYLTSNYGTDILLCLIKNSNYIAKCPLIMGSYYSDMLRRGLFENQKSINNVTVIDFCAFTDKDKVIKGAEVALRLFDDGMNQNIHKTLIPIFCDTECKKMVPLDVRM